MPFACTRRPPVIRILFPLSSSLSFRFQRVISLRDAEINLMQNNVSIGRIESIACARYVYCQSKSKCIREEFGSFCHRKVRVAVFDEFFGILFIRALNLRELQWAEHKRRRMRAQNFVKFYLLLWIFGNNNKNRSEPFTKLRFFFSLHGQCLMGEPNFVRGDRGGGIYVYFFFFCESNDLCASNTGIYSVQNGHLSNLNACDRGELGVNEVGRLRRKLRYHRTRH